jgi:chorismate synthase
MPHTNPAPHFAQHWPGSGSASGFSVMAASEVQPASMVDFFATRSNEFPMSGNTLGTLFCVTSFGESHGPAIGCVVDGCPPGLAISEAEIQVELDRRKPGTSRHVTQRREPDTVEILSGVFEGRTTGTPIALLIRNQDQRSKDYGNIAETFRPGHADYAYWQKYGIRDHRGGGRSSARETAVRVAAGAIAKKWLRERHGIVVRGCMSQLGPIAIPFQSWDMVPTNAFFAPNAAVVAELEAFMDELRKSGDSCGARIDVTAENVPVGWGEPVYDRLDADIAYAMMGINAVKGVEIGAGFACVAQRGTGHSDEMTPAGFLSNHAGGVVGGISTGQDIRVSIAIKPTSSIRLDRRSIDKHGNPVIVNTHGRHDPCVGIRATPIAEAMLALVLIDHALRHRGQNADVVCPTPRVPANAPRQVAERPGASHVDDPEPDEA